MHGPARIFWADLTPTSLQLYGIARFVAHGGSWHNFYMLTGGNNYAKQARAPPRDADPINIFQGLFLGPKKYLPGRGSLWRMCLGPR